GCYLGSMAEPGAEAGGGGPCSPAWSEHLFVGREHARNGGDQTLEFDRFGIELLAPSGNGLLALALLRMRGHADDWNRRRTASQRSSSGISRSIRITSGCSLVAKLQPFSLSSAARTSNPPLTS